MATLEIHDGKGNVSYRTISRDQPVVFGSDPKCDIVLDEPQVLPFHGRIVWSRTRYKVEAFPEARALEVDGKKVVSASYRQGSEIRVGDYRIFLVTPDDGLADFEKTRVQDRPQAAASPGPTAQVGPDWAFRGEVAPPSVEQTSPAFADDFEAVSQVLEEVPSRRTGRSRRARRKQGAPDKKNPQPARSRRFPWLREQAPGEERILSSPVVIGLALVLVVLTLIGVGLAEVIGRMAASRRFDQAMESYQNGDFRNAVERFDEFLTKFPNHKQVSEARVLGALAQVRQYTTGASPAWSNALETAAGVPAEVEQEPAYEDHRAEFASLVLDIATGLADRARTRSDAGALTAAEQGMALHDQIGGDSAAGVRARLRFPERLEAARAAVLKAEVRSKALAAMSEALKQEDPATVYLERDQLVARYSDLASDREVLERLVSANELIRRAVQQSAPGRPAKTSPSPERLGPPLSLVYRSSITPAAENPTLVYGVAEGNLYALDGDSGAPIWQRPIGLDCPFPPVLIPGSDSGLLIVDARSQELLRLDGRANTLVWRQDLGDLPDCPPLILGNQVFQTTPGGRLLILDLGNGTLQTEMNLGRPVTQTPVAEELGRRLYVLGREDIVFVINRDPPECLAVEYLGHEPGSVLGSPLRVGNYFVLAENPGPDTSRWSVFVLADEGKTFQLRQRIPFPGWLWATPASMGSVVWAITDRGTVEAFAIGAYSEREPFKRIARLAPEARVLGPTYPWARAEREIVVASGRSGRYDLDIEGATVQSRWSMAQAGPALAPIQTAGALVVLTQEPTELPGVMLWGVDPLSGAPRWRTLLGAPWTIPPIARSDRGWIETLDADGGPLLLARDQLESGGFVVQPLPAPGQNRLPPGRIGWAAVGDWTIVQPRPDSAEVWVRRAESADTRVINLPTRSETPLSAWGNDLLLAGTDGRVYRVDPESGTPTAEPFLPPFDPDRKARWLQPAVLDERTVIIADEQGTIRRLVVQENEPRRLVAEAESRLDVDLIANPAVVGNLVYLLTNEGRLRALSTRDLSPAGAWDLVAPSIVGPVTVNDQVYIGDVEGRVLAFSADARKLWELNLPDGSILAGEPSVLGGDLWLGTRAGHLVRVDRQKGEQTGQFDLDLMPIEGPIVSEDLTVLPSAPGTLQLVPPMPQ